MQYAQVLDNAEVVTPFAAKLSVAQQARNGELRSCVCLAWLKTYLQSRKFSHWTLVLSQRHNTPTHRHKKTKIKVVQGSDGKAQAFLNLIWPFKPFSLVLTLAEALIRIRYKRAILHTFAFFSLWATFLSLDLRWVSSTEWNWKLFLKEGSNPLHPLGTRQSCRWLGRSIMVGLFHLHTPRLACVLSSGDISRVPIKPATGFFNSALIWHQPSE